MTNHDEKQQTREFVAARVAMAGLAGALIASIANLGLYFVSLAAGVSMVGQYDPSAAATALPPAMVVVACVVPAIAATTLLVVLNAVTQHAGRNFAVLSVVGALLSMGGPATLPEADTATRVVLAAMHLIAAAAISLALLRGGRRAG